MAKQKINDAQVDFSDFGNVIMPAAAATSISITVTKRSMIHAYACARLTSGTAGGYKVLATVTSGTILAQRTTIHSQDQAYRYVGATAYIFVEPGTYTIARSVASGTYDQDSIVAMAIPTGYGI